MLLQNIEEASDIFSKVKHLRNIKKSSLVFEDIAIVLQKMQEDYRQKIQLNLIKSGDVSVDELRKRLEQI